MATNDIVPRDHLEGNIGNQDKHWKGVYAGNIINTYDTVALMKADVNLLPGDTVKTLGYSTLNDGRGAVYKIRVRAIDDVDDGDNILIFDEIRVAEKVFTDVIEPHADMVDSLGTGEKRWKAVYAGNMESAYPNVAAMIADNNLREGMTAKTLGYYSVNDGGAANYIIRAEAISDVDDGDSIIILDNGNVAEKTFKERYVEYTFLGNHVVSGYSDGVGSCILVRCQKTYQMIDTFTEYQNTNYVLPYLAANGITHIDNIFITHYHGDHCGGLVSMLTAGITTDMVYLPPELDWTEAAVINSGDGTSAKNWHDSIIAYLNENNIAWKYATNETVELKFGLSCKVFHTDYTSLYSLTTSRTGSGTNSNDSDAGIYADMNNYSVFYQFEYEGSKALFTGDANYTALTDEIDNFEKVQLWNVTHHNHDTFTVPEILQKLNPNVAVSQDTAITYGLSESALMSRKMGKYCVALGSKYYITNEENIVVRLSAAGVQAVEGTMRKTGETKFTYEEEENWKQNSGDVARQISISISSKKGVFTISEPTNSAYFNAIVAFSSTTGRQYNRIYFVSGYWTGGERTTFYRVPFPPDTSDGVYTIAVNPNANEITFTMPTAGTVKATATILSESKGKPVKFTFTETP